MKYKDKFLAWAEVYKMRV